MLKFAAILPHPPIIVPTIGAPADLDKVSKTIKAMEKLALSFAQAEVDTVVVISPHGPVDFNAFATTDSPTLAGHFYHFGDSKTELIFKNDRNFVALLEKESKQAVIPLKKLEIKELDHGVLVPLYYLAEKHPNFQVVPIAYSFLNLKMHFEFGKVLQKATEAHNKSVALIASGDLSHRLAPGAPAGFNSRGKEFDRKLIGLLKKKDTEAILNMPSDLIEEAGECGYRSIVILLGALSGKEWEPEVLSYEGPFGVGYLVASFSL